MVPTSLETDPKLTFLGQKWWRGGLNCGTTTYNHLRPTTATYEHLRPPMTTWPQVILTNVCVVACPYAHDGGGSRVCWRTSFFPSMSGQSSHLRPPTTTAAVRRLSSDRLALTKHQPPPAFAPSPPPSPSFPPSPLPDRAIVVDRA